MKQSRQSLQQVFQTQVEILSLTLQPFTVVKYQYVARYFVGYLRAEFPEVCRLSQLRRDPHMLGWFRWLCELRPPIGNHTRRQRLLCLRRLLNDLAAQGHPLQPGLIILEDLPTLPEYLPRVRWDPNNGHCMFLSESFTPNAWYPSTRKDYDC